MPFLRHSTLLSRYLRPIIEIKPYKFGSTSRDRKSYGVYVACLGSILGEMAKGKNAENKE